MAAKAGSWTIILEAGWIKTGRIQVVKVTVIHTSRGITTCKTIKKADKHTLIIVY